MEEVRSIPMESVDYKSLEEANDLLNQDDIPSSISKATPSRSPSKRSPSKSPRKLASATHTEEDEELSSPLKGGEHSDFNSNNHNPHSTIASTIMECGLKKIALIAAISATLIVVVVLAVVFSGGAAPKEVRSVSFKDAISGALYYQTASLSWISSKSYILKGEKLVEVAVDSKDEKVLVKNVSSLLPDRPFDYYFSESKAFLFYTTNVSHIYRHTTLARYTIYDVENEKKIKLKPSKASEDTSLQYASWSPVGNSLAFVHDNDIYYVKNPTAEPLRLTTDGEPEVVFNGVPDWVYEEEVLATDNALYWSPSGTRIAFLYFNDTEVPHFSFPLYGSSRGAYTKQDVFRYPKAGFTNPIVKLFVRDVASASTTSNEELLPPADHGLGDDYLVGNVKFRDDDSLLVIWTNRVQNESIISLCDVMGKSCHANIREDSSDGWSWAMPRKELYLAADGSKYFLVLPRKVGDDSFPHVAMVTTKKDVSEKGVKSFLTGGEKEVSSLVAIRRWDNAGSENHLLIYISSREKEAGARQRHLFVVDTRPQSKEKCLSCDEKVGRGCTYFSASIFEDSQTNSEDVVYFVLSCYDNSVLYSPGSPSAPFTATFRYKHSTGETGLVKTLQDNSGYAEKMAKYDWPTRDFFEAPIKTGDADDGLVIRGQVFLPPHFKKSVAKREKYPILFHIYSGPSTTKVNDKFVVDWHSYMATNQSFVIVNIDGRGSGMRGNKLRFSMYRKLGGPEIDDVIIAAKYLLEESKWKDQFDANRVGVWGWSYGGYASSHVLGRGSGVFTCGAAVAPVTSWIFYDSIYTERYMSTPKDNPSGYENTRVMDKKRVKHFRDVGYLLIHGTADDNVHFQNAMHLTTALIQREIPFETQVYPDKNHAISGPSYRAHLYGKLTEFFLHKCQRKKSSSRVSRSIEEDDDDHESRVKRSFEEEEEGGDDDDNEENVWSGRRRFSDHPACYDKDPADCL